MKLPYSFNFIIPCLILTCFCLFVVPAESAPQNFTYTENPSHTEFSNSIPRINKLATYEDGTVLVHLIRRNPDNTCAQRFSALLNESGACLEQSLFLRIIDLNGTVTEINLNNTNLGLDPVNFFAFVSDLGITTNPISVFPLQSPFILVNYVNMTNSSDVKTYEDWGMVIDWSGNIYSKLKYGKSYVAPDGHWSPNYSINLNINPAMGFLRFSTITTSNAIWQQYVVDNSGQLSLLSQDSFTVPNFSSFSVNVFSTVDQGYAIVYANSSASTGNNNTGIFNTLGGVYAFFLSYGQNITGNSYILYQTPIPNLTFRTVFCDIAFVGVGHVCTVSVSQTVQNTTDAYYLKIFFLSSGSVLSFTPISISNLTLSNVNVSFTGWSVTEMPFGGYTLNAITPLTLSTTNYYLYAHGLCAMFVPETEIASSDGTDNNCKIVEKEPIPKFRFETDHASIMQRLGTEEEANNSDKEDSMDFVY
ncbi:9688_t:CDS:2 [Acaulospora colombiana]|uniref:9688_t:CDS:1 n=1 Tax=Acaulospora colombiana TaxID=27376 RepID=A0ACA9KZV9_9GLOM|nr:9688_t:CDS:2 [Acaulospora colombiana]